MRVSQEALNLEGANLWHAASGFGGGIGGCGDVCGAIVGAVMAMGLAEGRREGQADKVSNRVRDRVQNLYDEFLAAFGSVDCLTLCGYHLRDREQFEAYKASDVKRTRCHEYVRFAFQKVLR